ncbi:hypothetical protein [Desulfurispora thermophila]|uniref:hypothetical protein n=1 Tax=Desulfurispora thermophila TaxID=265470 RepID=UPI0003699726|nr:hypothetical protein [Desulfurispora thermophila]
MPAWGDIAARLEAAGFNDFCIDYERGIAIVFFDGLLTKETPRQTEECRKNEFQANFRWAEYELRRVK